MTDTVDMALRPEQTPKPFMTIIPGRHPRQKLHATIGQAKNALSYYNYYSGGGYRSISPGVKHWDNGTRFIGRDAAAYEWNSETQRWVLLWEVHRGDRVPWEKD